MSIEFPTIWLPIVDMQSAVFILVTKIKAQQFSILHDRCAFCTNIIRTKFTVNHEIWLPQHDKTGILNNLQIVYKILRLIWLPSYTGHAIINKILVSLFLKFFFVLFSLCKAWRGNEVVKKCSKTVLSQDCWPAAKITIYMYFLISFAQLLC